MTKFSELIKKYREENNLTQQEFAEKLHVSRQAVSKWETGSSYPNYEILKDIALLLNTTVDNLLSKEEIVKETINVKSKNKRNVMLILLTSLVALIAIIIGITSIAIASNRPKQEEIVEPVEEPNVKYLGFFMMTSDYLTSYKDVVPNKEEYNKGAYPGIYIYESNGRYDWISYNRESTNHYIERQSSNKTTHECEFTFNVEHKILYTFYSYLNLDTNELYFENTGHGSQALQKNGGQYSFVIRNVFKEKEYEYIVSIKNIDDAKQTKIIEYDNEFKKIKETIVDYAYFDNSDKTYYTYKVSDECLYVIVEDEYDNKIEKRMIWREEMNKSILLYHSEDEMFTNFIAFAK